MIRVKREQGPAVAPTQTGQNVENCRLLNFGLSNTQKTSSVHPSPSTPPHFSQHLGLRTVDRHNGSRCKLRIVTAVISMATNTKYDYRSVIRERVTAVSSVGLPARYFEFQIMNRFFDNTLHTNQTLFLRHKILGYLQFS